MSSVEGSYVLSAYKHLHACTERQRRKFCTKKLKELFETHTCLQRFASCFTLLRQYQNLRVHCYLNYMNMSTIAQPPSPPLPFACSPPVGFCLERWTDSNQGSFKSALTHWSLKSFMLSSPFPVKAWFLLLAESTNPFPFKVLKNQQFLVHFSTAVSFPLSLLVFLFSFCLIFFFIPLHHL